MDILISGAGVAGPTLAFFLAQGGHRVTLVEQSSGTRSSGTPVDVRGPALAAATEMGVVAELREAATRVTELMFVDARGRSVGRMPMASQKDNIEIGRGALARILLASVADRAEIILRDCIVSLQPDASGVDVAFAHASARRFDIVVGADGLHSGVRELAFGREDELVEFMGMGVATAPVDGAALHLEPHRVLMHNEPGRALALHPGSDHAVAAFIFRAPSLASVADLASHYRGGGWFIPEVLAQALASDALFWDGVCRVDLASWSRGRVVLVGDAASCVSLFGDGSMLAMAGARTLAHNIHDFAEYEAAHRVLVNPRLKNVGTAARFLVPATRIGIGARNAAATVAGTVARVFHAGLG